MHFKNRSLHSKLHLRLVNKKKIKVLFKDDSHVFLSSCYLNKLLDFFMYYGYSLSYTCLSNIFS